MEFKAKLLERKKYFTTFHKENFFEFNVCGMLSGYVKKDFAQILVSNFADDFFIQNNRFFLVDKYDSFDSRSLFFYNLSEYLNAKNIISSRNEDMLVKSFYEGVHLFKIDRSLIGKFGILAEGIHINAYVKRGDKKYLWLTKRSNTIVEPNKYDNLVGGAVSFGYSIFETLIKESAEEAGIPRELAVKSLVKNTLQYKVERLDSLRNDIVHIFDLEIPENFTPIATDGEVGSFHLLSMEEVLLLLKDVDGFKFNSWLVAFHFILNNYLDFDVEYKKILKDLFNIIGRQ